ncbi:MAG: T9SS type A sorting domain-containing protein [Tannerella sp.]|jgi:hypothetical protein|nr:T9SS type A sorting domain-containing protein [Tannerella sp.]
MRRKFTWIYILGLLLSLSAFHAGAQGRKPIDSLYYYMRIDTSGVDVGYLRIHDLVGDEDQLVVDNVRNDYAQWRFVLFRKEDGITIVPNHYWIINLGTGDTLKLKAPVSVTDTLVFINPSGNLFRWEQLFLPGTDSDTLLTSYLDASLVPHSFFLTLGTGGGVMLSEQHSNNYRRLRFHLERTTKPSEDKFYRIHVDTLGSSTALGFLTTDSIVRKDSLTLDTALTDYAAWKFITDTVISDTTYFKIYNKATDSLLAFDIPAHDTVALMHDAGELNSWLIPFYVEDGGVGRFMVRDTVSDRTFYLGLKDSVVMLVSDTSDVQFILFSLGDEFPPPYVPPVVYPFDSTRVYKVKMLSGNNAGKYLATGTERIGTTLKEYYTDSVYAHIPDGQFAVNKLNKNSLINRNIASIVTDTFYYELDTVTHDTIPDHFVYRGDTVEVKPVTVDTKDSLLGYRFFPESYLRKDSCFYLLYVSTDSLNGRILGTDDEIHLLPLGDTARFFIEYVRTDYGAEAPAGIAQLKRSVYKLRSQDDTTNYFASNSPSEMTTVANNAGLFLFKEEKTRGGYSLIVGNITSPLSLPQKFIIDSISKHLDAVPFYTDTFSLFRFVKVEVPVYPDDEYLYLRYLPQGRGLYEVRNTSGLKLTKNFYDYAVFSREGESVLKSGSYVPKDFYLWIDTACGPGSNRFRTSIYIIKDATDTANFNVRGSFLHVFDPADVANSTEKSVVISSKKYSRGNFIPAHRTAANQLQIDTVTRGTLTNEQNINEYRFYLQKTEADTTRYYIVTEKGYGGAPDSTGYLSYSFRDEKYYFGPRESTDKIMVTLAKTSGPVGNEVITAPPSRPALDGTAKKEIAVTGGTGWISVHNAMDSRIQIYNIVGQMVADKVAASDNEQVNVPRGIAIVKVGKTVTKKIVVR